MQTLKRALFLLPALLCCAGAHAAVVEGWLELQWGDSARDLGGEYFSAALVTDNGARFVLDTGQALHAAKDLYSLGGRRIAVDFVPVSKDASRYGIAAIVPADDVAIAQPGGKGVLGTTVWLTLMCKFSNIATEQKDLNFFQSQYGNSPGQLDHYWRDVSYNKVNLAGSSAHGWFVLPHPRSFYLTIEPAARRTQLFNDCTAAADARVDFAAGGGVQGVNMMFNGEFDSPPWGGYRCKVLDGINKCWSSTWNPPWSFADIAVLAHEMGHGYGLPHSNNSDGDADPYDNPWDLMSDILSNAPSDPVYGAIAKHLNTNHRDQLGWMDATRKRLVTAGTDVAGVQLDRASLSGSLQAQMIVVQVPGELDSRYYTIEARTRAGSYDANVAGDAVIIHQVDTGRLEPAWSVDADMPPADRANNEGSMFKVGETWRAPANAFLVRVMSENANGFVVNICAVPGVGRRATACNLIAATAAPLPRHDRPIVPATGPSITPCAAPRHCPQTP